MAELKLKDFVDESEVQKLIELDNTIEHVKATYVSAAKELAKGLKINVDGIEDLEKLTTLYNTQIKKTSEANTQLIDAGKKQEEIVHKVADAISKNTTELEKENTKKTEAYQVDKRALDIAKDILGSRGQNLEQLIKLESELKSISEAQKKLNEAEKNGDITGGALLKKREALVERERTLKAAKSELNTVLTREEKLLQAAVGSYDEMSHSLELMKRAYKQMNETEKSSTNGKVLASEIQKADKQLKEISASMGEFQRNVGNYTGALNNEYAPAIKNALGLNNTFADSLLKLSETGEDGGGFFDNLSTKTKAFGNTLLTLLKNPVFLSIAGIAAAGAAFKFWYDYNKGLVEASRLTTQFTGLHGDEMKHYRNEVQTVADTFEVDFKETLIATNAVSKQFGISASDSLKLIKDGFIAGANANGEFLENLKEYPAYFKEAGLSASQFIAITTQANKAGLYSDKGIDVIKEGNLRIREMTNATATALDGIGISSKKVLEDLRNGNITTFDVMKKVSEKLDELPDSCSAVGTAIADIFGGPGEDAGLQYIRTLKDIDTELDNVKRRTGEFAEVQEELLASQTELSNAVSDMFDATGGGFETLIAKAKIFANDALKDILNYLNQITSSAEALGAQRLNKAEQQGKEAARTDKEWQENAIAGIKRMAEKYKQQGMEENAAYKKAKEEHLAIMKRALAIEEDETSSYVKQNKGFNEELKNSSFWRQGIGLDRTNAQIEKDINSTFDLIEFRTASLASQKEKINILSDFSFEPTSGKSTGKTTDELKREEDERKKIAEEAKKILVIRRDLEDSKIELMDDGLDKELAKIKQDYLKRIDAITGNSNAEKAIKLNLQKQMQNELQQYEQEYAKQVELKGIENKLSIVKKGTEEELNLNLKQLDIQREAEIDAAEKTGEDVFLIDAKYAKKKQELYEKHASDQISLIAENAAHEQQIRDTEYAIEMLALKKKLATKQITQQQFAEEEYKLKIDYARKTAEATIDALEMELAVDKNISEKDRIKIAEELQKVRANLAKQEAEFEIDAIKGVTKADDDAKKKRLKNLKQWLQTASQAVGAIGDLVSTLYDGQIEKIEEEQDANDEKYEKDTERVQNLIDNGVISEEEGEARKRAAKAQTEAKNAELEKKKQEMEHKQAVWNKGVQVAQTGIATARGIMEAWQMGPAGAVFAAIVAAMGAIQIATILATPIPSYAEGTKDSTGHRGGTALVGDAGKREVVMYAGKAWITPNTPTLVDLPRGAHVFPDVDSMDFPDWSIGERGSTVLSANLGVDPSGKPIIINDYRDLKSEMQGMRQDFRKMAKQVHMDAYERDFRNYIQRRL